MSRTKKIPHCAVKFEVGEELYAKVCTDVTLNAKFALNTSDTLSNKMKFA